MGDLPKDRVQPARPFLNSGVDFGGPVYLKEGRGRGCYHRPSGAVELSSPSSGPVSRFVDRCRFNAGVANAPRRRR
jgi:hypothetical protein